MKDNPDQHGSEEERRIDEEALDWLIRMDVGFSPEDQDAFFQWLAADARHGEYLAVDQKTYNQFDAMVQWRPEHSDEPNPDLLAKPWMTRKRVMALSLVASAAVILLGLVIWPALETSEVYYGYLPEKGMMAHEYQIHELQDGSVVELNQGAQLEIRYDRNERRVDLLSGEAYFKVAKNPERPFFVSARGIDVKAVGTAFNVRLEKDSLEVLVTHGRVQVVPPTLMNQSQAGGTENPPIVHSELAAGQRSLVSFSEEYSLPVIEDVPPVDLQQELAWKARVLEFVARPLSEIVEEFNRYNSTVITIEDRELRDFEITATFRSNNVEGFVRVLELTHPIEARMEGHDVVYLSKRKDRW